MSPGITVTADLRPTRCTCRCGCTYPFGSEASVASGRCLSCRRGVHAGRRKGWTPGQQPDPSDDPGPRHG